jgi:hypothetical protein
MKNTPAQNEVVKWIISKNNAGSNEVKSNSATTSKYACRSEFERLHSQEVEQVVQLVRGRTVQVH